MLKYPKQIYLRKFAFKYPKQMEMEFIGGPAIKLNFVRKTILACLTIPMCEEGASFMIFNAYKTNAFS